MSIQKKFRGGTASENAVFIGGLKEITVETTNKRIVVHDGVRPGGYSAARLDEVAIIDADGFALIEKLPLTSDQCRAALSIFLGTTGLSGMSWLSIVEDDISVSHADTQDVVNIRYNGVFWPIGGAAWTYVRTVLKAYFSWSDATADVHISAVQDSAKTNR